MTYYGVVQTRGGVMRHIAGKNGRTLCGISWEGAVLRARQIRLAHVCMRCAEAYIRYREEYGYREDFDGGR